MHDMFDASIDVVHSDLFIAVRVYPAACSISRSWLQGAPGIARIFENARTLPDEICILYFVRIRRQQVINE